MAPADFNLPVGGYTEKNYSDADMYSKNKLLQQQICSLVALEPVTYSFVNITNQGIDGWKSLGIEIERGQALAPFYEITYNVDKLDCSKFSCLPIDVRDNKNGIGSCNFKKTPAIDINFGLKSDMYTACGEACYSLSKRIDPHTGLPKASGNLMIKGENGICNYINQNLLLWGTLPQSRVTQSGDIVNGYNDNFVPPFTVIDNGMYNKLEITQAYCQYFKRWFNDKEKKCYRSTWMKLLHMTFGTAISNVFFPQNTNMINNARTKVNMRKLKYPNVEKIIKRDNDKKSNTNNKIKMMSSAITDILTSSILSDDNGGSGDETTFSKADLPLSQLALTTPTNTNARITRVVNNSIPNNGDVFITDGYLKDLNEKKLDSIKKLKDEMISFLKGNEKKYRVRKKDKIMAIERKAENIIETLIDFVVICKVHKVKDLEARRLILSKILHVCKNDRCVKLPEALQIINLYSKIKNIMFPNARLREKKQQHPLFKSDDDLTMFVNDRYRIHEGETSPKSEKPPYIIQMVKSITGSGNNTSASTTFIPSLLNMYPFMPTIRKSLTNIAFHLWNDLHDLISPDWARYNDDFSYDNNFFVMLMVDNVIHKSLSYMATACRNIVERLSVRTIESLAARGALMAEDALTTVFSRMVISTAQRLAVDFLVRGAIVTALEIFVELAALVAGVLDGIGILLIVGGVLGMVLDLALNMTWYDNVMTPETLASHIKNYVTAFKSTTDLTAGEIAPVTPKELVEIAINSEMNSFDENKNDYETFLNTYFDEKPLIGSKTETFLQEAYFEYLGTKTMNSLGQPLSRATGTNNNSSNNGGPITAYLDGGKEKIVKLLHTGSKYTDMVTYNAPRVTAYNLEHKEDRNHFVKLESLQETRIMAKWTMLGAGVSMLIGTLVLFFGLVSFWQSDIPLNLFLVAILIYIFLLARSHLAITKTRIIVCDFIKNSRLFNLNENNLMKYKDVEELKENSASVRYFFSEFTKPFSNFIQTSI